MRNNRPYGSHNIYKLTICLVHNIRESSDRISDDLIPGISIFPYSFLFSSFLIVELAGVQNFLDEIGWASRMFLTACLSPAGCVLWIGTDVTFPSLIILTLFPSWCCTFTGPSHTSLFVS